MRYDASAGRLLSDKSNIPNVDRVCGGKWVANPYFYLSTSSAGFEALNLSGLNALNSITGTSTEVPLLRKLCAQTFPLHPRSRLKRVSNAR